MTSAQALDLFAHLLRVVLVVAGPPLMMSLVAGLVVGILQAATQINEASISFVVKISTVGTLLVVLGPMLVANVVDYTRSTFMAIEHVVR